MNIFLRLKFKHLMKYCSYLHSSGWMPSTTSVTDTHSHAHAHTGQTTNTNTALKCCLLRGISSVVESNERKKFLLSSPGLATVSMFQIKWESKLPLKNFHGYIQRNEYRLI